jgi:antirestriction protein ArdC
MDTNTASNSLSERQPTSWENLLRDAVEKPGRIHAAYTAFHGYSIGNQLLALWQCSARGIEPGPISTYKSWQEKGRQVRKGEKAITLCQPVTVKGKRDDETDDDAEAFRTVFVYRPSWFVASQTDGAPIVYPETVGWDRNTALRTLEISEVPFHETDGNCQGYAIPDRREIAINPVAALPMKTTLHETAHCLLHAGEQVAADGLELPRSLREVEAESVALIVTEALGLEGVEYSRGYIQGWLRGNPIPEPNARRIFAAAEKILRAGEDPTLREIAQLKAEIAARQAVR